MLQIQCDERHPAQLKKLCIVCVPDFPKPSITMSGRVSMLMDLCVCVRVYYKHSVRRVWL